MRLLFAKKPLHFKGNCQQNEEGTARRGENTWIFANYATDEGLISRIYKHLEKLDSNQANSLLKATNMERHFSADDIKMTGVSLGQKLSGKYK